MFFKCSITTILLLQQLVFISCTQKLKPIDSSQKIDTANTYNKIEEKIFDTIYSLTEVKERAKYIDKKTNGKRHLQVLIYGTPNSIDKKYYWIKVGEDNGIAFVSHFIFFVYPDLFRVMFFDTKTDKEFSLAEWRKLKK